MVSGPEGAGAPSALDEAVAAIAAGEVIGLPTDTVYGIGVDPFRPDATKLLFEVKGRPETVALPVLVADPGDAADLAVVDETVARLVAAFWPGPLTIVCRQASGTADRRLHLGGDGATVGLRCPANPVARSLLRRTGPLAVTSANRHGEPPAHTAAELAAALGSRVRLILDGGRCDGRPSTVVSAVGLTLEVLREGEIGPDALARAAAGRPRT